MDSYAFLGLWCAAGGVICMSTLVISYWLKRLTFLISDALFKLTSVSGKDNAGTVLLPVTKLDLKTDCTTVLPLPMGAEICSHKMEVIVNETIKAPHEQRAIIVLQCTKCGAIDKTVVHTSSPPEPLPPKCECRHEWVKEKTINLDSAFEQMEAVIKEQYLENKKTTPYYNKPKKQEEIRLNVSNLPSWMFRKTSIRERICRLCGEIDRIVSSNFDLPEGIDLPSVEGQNE